MARAKKPTPSTPITPAALVPYDWQQADIDKCVRLMNDQVGALVASAPGAGKTLVGVEIMKALACKVILIIAPQGTHSGAWGKTVQRQGLNTAGVRYLKGDKKGKAALADLQWGREGVYVTTRQWFARQRWDAISPDAVIFDEIHEAGSYGIATSQALVGKSQRKGLTAEYRLGLSGTPLRNKFENAWSLIRWLEPAKMPLDYYIWRMTKCALKRDPFAPQGFKVVGERNPGELFNSLTCYIQHLQREKCCDFHPEGFLAGLPAPLEIDRVVEMSVNQRRFYKSIEAAVAASLISTEGEEVKVHTEHLIVARGMLRAGALGLPNVDEESGKLTFMEDCDSPKLDALIEDLPTYEGRHTLILTHSKKFAKIAVDRIEAAGYTVEGWHGDVTKTKRDAILAAFTSGELEIIVGVIAAMGTGTDGLQEVCWNVSWLSLDDDPTNNVQGIGRLDRLGQNQQVVTRRYLSNGTIDVGMYDKQIEKIMLLNETLRKEAA